MSSECSGCKFSNPFGGCELEGPCVRTATTASGRPSVPGPENPDATVRVTAPGAAQRIPSKTPTKVPIHAMAPVQSKRKHRVHPPTWTSSRTFEPIEGAFTVRKDGHGEVRLVSDDDQWNARPVADERNLLPPGGGDYLVNMGARVTQGRAPRLVIAKRLRKPRTPKADQSPTPTKVAVQDRTPTPLKVARRRHHEESSDSDES